MLQPSGTLELLDVRRTLLDQSVARAAGQGLTNVSATLGDGRRLPYPDEHFDAAFLVATLGEIGDDGKAIAELARVLRPAAAWSWARPSSTRTASARGASPSSRSTPACARADRRAQSYVARYEKPR